MATDTWNTAFEAEPADGDAASSGDDEIRKFKLAVRERLELDHSMAGDNNDGYHKWATLMEQASDPGTIAQAGRVYSKDVSGITELFYMDSAGTVKQITTNGSIVSETNFASGTAGQILTTNAAEGGSEFWVPPDYMSGTVITTDADANNDLNITPFAAADSTNARVLKHLTETTKQADNDFATGDDAGGMAPRTAKTGTFTSVSTAVTGSGTAFDTEFAVGDILYSSSNSENRIITAIASATAMTIEAFTTDVSSAETVQKNGKAPNATYRIYAIRNTTTGAIEIYYDTSTTAVEIITGYAGYRDIGWFTTDSSGNIKDVSYLLNGNTETGTWTITIQDESLSDGEGQTYGLQAGTYTKTGKQMVVQGYVQLTSIGTLTGGDNSYLAGLPYASDITTAMGGVNMQYAIGLAIGAGDNVSGNIVTNTTYFQLRKWSSTVGTTILTITEVSANGEFIFTGSYYTT